MLNFNFPNGSGVIIEEFHFFHDWIISFLVGIVAIILLYIGKTWDGNRNANESQCLEIVWTMLPGVVLLAIGIPSLKLLYLTESGCLVPYVKAVGNQWYWQYFYTADLSHLSYLTSHYRLLSTDNSLILQKGQTDMLITARDVLHSWTVPTIGAKADAVPGRINKLIVTRCRHGMFFGQCREICGRNHRFIPISVSIFNRVHTLKVYLEKVKHAETGRTVITGHIVSRFFYLGRTKNPRLYPSTEGAQQTENSRPSRAYRRRYETTHKGSSYARF